MLALRIGRTQLARNSAKKRLCRYSSTNDTPKGKGVSAKSKAVYSKSKSGTEYVTLHLDGFRKRRFKANELKTGRGEKNSNLLAAVFPSRKEEQEGDDDFKGIDRIEEEEEQEERLVDDEPHVLEGETEVTEDSLLDEMAAEQDAENDYELDTRLEDLPEDTLRALEEYESKMTYKSPNTTEMEPREKAKVHKVEKASQLNFYRLAMYDDLRKNADRMGNYPITSAKARRKAWELHCLDPEYWTMKRLSAVFKVRADEMKFYMYVKATAMKARKLGPQYVNAGKDDRIEQLLGKEFGELDFPDTIMTPGKDDPPKVDNIAYYHLDDNVRSQRLKQMVSSMSKKYREAPKYARQFIPKPRALEAILPSRARENIYKNKKLAKFIMWDISPSRDLYNRKVLVRETDGSWRTGDWDERRFTHEARRYMRWRLRVPIHIPDDEQESKVHPDEQVPEGYKPSMPNPEKWYPEDATKQLQAMGSKKGHWGLKGFSTFKEVVGQYKVRYD